MADEKHSPAFLTHLAHTADTPPLKGDVANGKNLIYKEDFWIQDFDLDASTDATDSLGAIYADTV